MVPSSCKLCKSIALKRNMSLYAGMLLSDQRPVKSPAARLSKPSKKAKVTCAAAPRSATGLGET